MIVILYEMFLDLAFFVSLNQLALCKDCHLYFDPSHQHLNHQSQVENIHHQGILVIIYRIRLILQKHQPHHRRGQKVQKITRNISAGSRA